MSDWNLFLEGICPFHINCQIIWHKVVYCIISDIYGSVATSPFSFFIMAIYSFSFLCYVGFAGASSTYYSLKRTNFYFTDFMHILPCSLYTCFLLHQFLIPFLLFLPFTFSYFSIFMTPMLKSFICQLFSFLYMPLGLIDNNYNFVVCFQICYGRNY